MYYYTYKITNTINDKIYIGVHQTNDVHDDYMGSGKYLKHSQNKHGIENFKKEILEYFNNSTDMYNIAQSIIDSEKYCRM